MSQLQPCPSCGRHVRVSESTCPFCTSALALEPAAPGRGPVERLGRAAIMAFGAAAAVSTISACTGDPAPAYGGPPPDDHSMLDGGGLDAAYGGPPPWDAGPDEEDDAAAPEDAAVDEDAGVAPAYGGPGPDAGLEEADAGPPDEDGGAAPAYGGPPEA